MAISLVDDGRTPPGVALGKGDGKTVKDGGGGKAVDLDSAAALFAALDAVVAPLSGGYTLDLAGALGVRSPSHDFRAAPTLL